MYSIKYAAVCHSRCPTPVTAIENVWDTYISGRFNHRSEYYEVNIMNEKRLHPFLRERCSVPKKLNIISEQKETIYFKYKL